MKILVNKKNHRKIQRQYHVGIPSVSRRCARDNCVGLKERTLGVRHAAQDDALMAILPGYCRVTVLVTGRGVPRTLAVLRFQGWVCVIRVVTAGR